jgi:hypothetical protein
VKPSEKYCSVVVTANEVVAEPLASLPCAVTFSEPAVVATAAKVTVISVPPRRPYVLGVVKISWPVPVKEICCCGKV